MRVEAERCFLRLLPRVRGPWIRNSDGEDMACQKLLVDSVAANESLVIVPPDTQILNFTHVLIYVP